ncbi:hypothetical protein Tco_1554344 [Tanacetum coccineum]
MCANILECFRNRLIFSSPPPKNAMLWDSIISQSFLWISSRNPKLKFSCVVTEAVTEAVMEACDVAAVLYDYLKDEAIMPVIVKVLNTQKRLEIVIKVVLILMRRKYRTHALDQIFCSSMGSTSLLLIWWRVLISYILADDKARANVYKCGKVPLSYLRFLTMIPLGMLTVEKIPLVTEEYTAKINGLRDMITRIAHIISKKMRLFLMQTKLLDWTPRYPRHICAKELRCFNLEAIFNAKTAFEACASLLPEDASFTK